jgi:ubiquinone/menaquinone biosynthesis C-methylase UbiE
MDSGDQFADRSVAEAYASRPPIPPPILGRLRTLLPPTPRVALDAGCGSGAVAGYLAPGLDRVDAVDPSAAMIAVGRERYVNATNIRWIQSAMETAVVEPPYGLIVCAGSLHWMDLDTALPRFGRLLAASGSLAVAYQRETDQPWSAELRRLILAYSTNRDEHRYGLFRRLATSSLFAERGRFDSEPAPFRQSIASYIESIHSRSGLSRERMTADREFDRSVANLVEPYAIDGYLTLRITGHLLWGHVRGDDG